MLQFRNLCRIKTICKAWYSTDKYSLKLTLKGVPLIKYIENLENEYVALSKSSNISENLKANELKPVALLLQERRNIIENLSNLTELLEDKDDDIKKLATEEKSVFEGKIEGLDSTLLQMLLPSNEEDSCNSMILEVNSGVGGQEAMLFAGELYEMYSSFAQFMGWETQMADYTETELGGIRHGGLLINGADSFRFFKYEAGVHRVQRIPSTEKAGRIHTSTASVLALPQPNDIQIKLESKDLRIETKRASGAGGQHVNTTDSAVRITHLPTGLSVECQVDRSQIKNRQIAMIKLKTLLYQKQLDEQIAKDLETRRTQVRTKYRNEKIRTYNYSQDRITDHRLPGVNFHNLKGFLQGNHALRDLILKLDEQNKVDLLLELVHNFNKNLKFVH